MTDCPKAEIRDLLPDYVHEVLGAVDAAAVEQHVATCSDCADELALLRTALAVRPRAAAIDVAAIVARLPRPATAVDTSVRALSSAPSVQRRGTGWRSWQVAAAIAIMTVGGMSLAIARQGMFGVTATAPLSDTSAVTAVAVAGQAGAADPATVAATRGTALSVGELSDFSDAELEAVMDRLSKWDGAAATDPLPGVPLLPVSSGGAR